MGYGDPGCYQEDSKTPTPNLDRMAAGGMRFTNAHTPSSVCTPTRYTLLTGRYCWRTRLTSGVLDGFSPPLIENDRSTIASLLKDEGYTTACIGKWHLGMQWTRLNGSPEDVDRAEGGFRPGDNIDFSKPITAGPLTNGFESYFGISASLDMPPYCWIENDRCDPAPDTQIESARENIFRNENGGKAHSAFEIPEVLPTLKARTVAWIEERSAEKPFFLYLPLNSPHMPVAPSDAFQGKSGAGIYADFVMETDDLVGAVLDTLKKKALLENTMIVFTSDNGGLWHAWEAAEPDDLVKYKPTDRGRYNLEHGHRSNAHLRGTKADIWEGGHRVPFLVHWPAKVAGGETTDALVELTDLYATCSEAFGIPTPEGAAEDSFSFLGVLTQAGESSRPFGVHHSLRGMFAVRQGDWKYVEARGSGGFSQPRIIEPKPGEPEGQLYNLSTDPSETRNVYLERPEIVERMEQLLKQAQAKGLRGS